MAQLERVHSKLNSGNSNDETLKSQPQDIDDSNDGVKKDVGNYEAAKLATLLEEKERQGEEKIVSVVGFPKTCQLELSSHNSPGKSSPPFRMSSFQIAKAKLENYVYRIPPWLPTRVWNILSEEERQKYRMFATNCQLQISLPTYGIGSTKTSKICCATKSKSIQRATPKRVP